MPLPRFVFPGQGPCQGVISQQVGPAVPVTIPGQGLLLGLLEQRITWPDQILRTHQSPPEQVSWPSDQPELKKQRQWSHNQNNEVMYCHPMAIKDKPRGYQKRMHQQWKDRGNIKCTEQRLCDQKKQIEDKTLLTPPEIEEVKQQVKVMPSKRKMTNKLKKNNRQQLLSWTWSQPWSRRPNTTNLSWNTRWWWWQWPTEIWITRAAWRSQIQDNDREKKLSKLKNDRNLKRVIKNLDKIIEETSTDNMDLTTTNQMQYMAALLITNKITPPKPATKWKPRGGPPAW